jgi:hypothetical protein
VPTPSVAVLSEIAPQAPAPASTTGPPVAALPDAGTAVSTAPEIASEPAAELVGAAPAASGRAVARAAAFGWPHAFRARKQMLVRALLRRQAHRRTGLACGSTVPARTTPALLGDDLGQAPAHLRRPPAAPAGKREGEASNRTDDSPAPSAPRLPAPDDAPPLPSAPGSLLGSGGPGGAQCVFVLCVVAVLFNLLPPGGGRRMTLVERRGRALRLYFFQERPG